MHLDSDSLLRLTYRLDLRFNRLIISGIRFLRHLFYFSTLGNRGLQILTDLYYDSQKHYASDRHNQSGLFPWEEAVVNTHFADKKRVLVTSCGGGRELLALAEQGHDVVGVECHPELCHAAAQLCGAHENVEVHCLPPAELPPNGNAFDGIVVGWGGYSHMTPRSTRISFLKQLADVLHPGGPLLVSYLGRPERPGRSLSVAIANIIRGITFRRRLEPGDTLSLGFCHHFHPGEGPSEAREAGLEVLFEATVPPGIQGFAMGQYPHFVARKPASE